MKSLLVQYGYLQVLDLLTTLAFLKSGLKEGNPLIANVIYTGASPVTVLVTVKLCALSLGIYCCHVQRRTAISRANTFYALLVAWNLICLIVGSGTPPIAIGGRA
jgi:hypothetical protein